ncbi:MAG: hypothetical protein IKL48_04800 [Elusimicrobiaceae bacterium]|nr:hypothetical protein [Alphaproteobacteria bacterium]MBR3603976.1 hypothetical protein [Elusimicrobiaceae bacterium]
MKRILVVLCCLLAPLFMQAGEYSQRPIPSDVVEAFFIMNNHPTNSDMTLLQAEEKLKGTIVVQISMDRCTTCIKMKQAMDRANIVNLWSEKGVRFYQIDADEEYPAKHVNDFYGWIKENTKIETVPLIMIFKNGKFAGMRNGYEVEPTEEYDAKFIKILESIS